MRSFVRICMRLLMQHSHFHGNRCKICVRKHTRALSLTHRGCDLPFVITTLDKDLKGQGKIGLARCQHLRAIRGPSLEVGRPAAPRALAVYTLRGTDAES